jgi:nucleoside-diphosphate-sugar epimerase
VIIGITGGTGFIGRKLLRRHLSAGDSVRILSRRSAEILMLPKAVKVFTQDLMDPRASLIPFVDGIDVLYHCAGEIKDEGKMYPLHIEGAKNLCVAATNRIRRWVQLSSVGVYGSQYCGVVTENTPLNPVGIYEETKAKSDQVVIDSADRGAFTYAILRPANVFGPNMKNQSLFQMIAMIDKDFFFFIGETGALANYIHVDNVVEGLIQCGKNPAAKGQIYNLSDNIPIEKFVEIIAKELKKSMPKIRLPEKPIRLIARQCNRFFNFPLTENRIDALTKRSWYSIKKIQDELGYSHQVSIENGLRQMVMQKKNFDEKN